MAYLSTPTHLGGGTATATLTRTVTDSPAYAWNGSDQGCLSGVPREFIAEHRDAIDQAAIRIIESPLQAGWRRRGYAVEFVSSSALESLPATPEDPADDTYWQVRDAAAADIDFAELLKQAELTDTYAAWH